MVEMSEFLTEMLDRYINEYEWPCSLVSHLFKKKYGITITVRDYKKILKNAPPVYDYESSFS